MQVFIRPNPLFIWYDEESKVDVEVPDIFHSNKILGDSFFFLL